VLVIGLTSEEQIALREDLATVRVVDSPTRVALQDFDLLVTDVPGSAADASDVTNVLHIARDRTTQPHHLVRVRPAADSEMHLGLQLGTMATEFEEGADLPGGVPELLEDVAAEAAATVTAGSLQLFKVTYLGGSKVSADLVATNSQEATRPFLVATDGSVVAGALTSGGGHEVWFLPDTACLREWVRVACAHWSTRWPDRFPRAEAIDDWWRSESWQTAAEREVRARQDDVEQRRTEALAALETESEALATELERVAAAVDETERRLLTAQGDELKAAAVDGLRLLGFDVVDMDNLAEGPKLEDLRITDPDDPEWIAVCEVRGYRSGAKVTDLWGKLRRYRENFIMATKRMPSATWYLVNHHIELPADRRPQVLQGADDDVQTFAESADGLVIETATLYAAVRAVEAGTEPAEIRRALRAARGRFQLAKVQ